MQENKDFLLIAIISLVIIAIISYVKISGISAFKNPENCLQACYEENCDNIFNRSSETLMKNCKMKCESEHC